MAEASEFEEPYLSEEFIWEYQALVTNMKDAGEEIWRFYNHRACMENYIKESKNGEGSIMLTRMHKGENRRPSITICSSDMELLIYVQKIAGGRIYSKKNYQPNIHKDSYTLVIKKRMMFFVVSKKTYPFLRITQKSKRAKWILD